MASRTPLRSTLLVRLLTLSVLALSCDDSPVDPPANEAVSLIIHGDSTLVLPGIPANGQVGYYTVSAVDAQGESVTVPPGEVEWSAGSNARIDERELSEGVLLYARTAAPGTARIHASWRGLSASLDVQFLPAPPAGEITVMLTTTLLYQGQSTEVWLWALDEQGNEIPDSLVTLTSDVPGMVSFEWTPGGWHARGMLAGFTNVRASIGGQEGSPTPLRVVYAPMELAVFGPDTLIAGESVGYAYYRSYGDSWFDDSLIEWTVSDPSVLRIVGTSVSEGRTRVQVEAIGAGQAEVRVSATGPEGTVSAALPVTVVGGAGTSRILYLQFTPDVYERYAVTLLTPELGVSRTLESALTGVSYPLTLHARADGAYAYALYLDNPTGSDYASIVLADTLGVRRTLDFASRDGEPVLHPTEDVFAFTIRSGSFISTGPSSIAVASFSGELLDSLALGSSPTWSPDGDTIAFSRNNAIWKISRHGGPETLVAQLDGSVLELDWSPDGTRFIFGYGSGVYVMDADGSDLQRVANGGSPDWAPDSERFVFVQSGGLVIGRVGTSEVTPLPTDPTVGAYARTPVWTSLE